MARGYGYSVKAGGLILAFVGVLLGGCESRPGPDVVATTGMVTDLVRVVAGDRLQVEGLIGEGVDPHLFTPGRRDVERLMSAPVVVYSGLHLEGRMQQQFEQLRERQRGGQLVFAATDGLDPDVLRFENSFEGHPDPHVWMDVARWSQCVQYVADQLAGYDDEGRAVFEASTEAYCEQLRQLDAYIRRVISSVPESQRHLVTAHDAFEYFAEAYGIEVRSIQGMSTDSQAAIADVNALVEFIVEQKIPAIFIESSVPEKNIRAVIEGCAARGWEVSVGGELFSDAMGAPGTYEGTYLGMMDHNATTIARALGGQAPELGWQGKLAERAATRRQGSAAHAEERASDHGKSADQQDAAASKPSVSD
jgi:manganese/zinc/iron transport system substrate-binding protein